MLAPVLHSCSFAQIERTLAQAIDVNDPDEAERRRLKAADDRSFDIPPTQAWSPDRPVSPEARRDHGPR